MWWFCAAQRKGIQLRVNKVCTRLVHKPLINLINPINPHKPFFTFAAVPKFDRIMSKNEEYTENRGRDWLLFIVSLIGTLALLFVSPEWVWVGFPFVFTSLAGAMGRL